MNAPYCEHPECHSPRTNNYQPHYGSSANRVPGEPTGVTACWSSEAMPGWRRLCRIHALMAFRFAVGS